MESRVSCAALWLTLIAVCSTVSASADETVTALSEHNVSVPFCYVRGGERSWPIIRRPLYSDEAFTLIARRAEEELGRGTSIQIGEVSVSITEGGMLRVDARSELDEAAPLVMELEVQLKRGGAATESQRLSVRPAPSPKPISYVADLVDDLIRIYGEPEMGRFKPISKDAFDQYFRRLQAHGVSRLIVWHSPFPYFTRPEDHDPDHWKRYQLQALAILEHADLEQSLSKSRTLPSWLWMRFLLELRLNPKAGATFAQSAAEHGISLTASFRPFESALTKYYEVPTFDLSGEYLWGFLPLATPLVNYQPERVCFGHYREVLDRMGHPELGRLTTIELPGITREEVVKLVERFGPTGGFELQAAPQFPPVDSDSYVLVRQSGGEFRLQPYREIRELAEARQHSLSGFRLEAGADGTARLSGVELSHELRFLMLNHVGTTKENLTLELDKEIPVQLRSQAGNRLNRETIYWVFDEKTPAGHESRIAGITPDGEYRAVFQACTSSINTLLSQPQRVPLASSCVVIDRGALWSVEMLDFQQPATRELAVTQLKTLLDLRGPDSTRPVYDEIFISTRSHVDLAPTMADGVDGQQSLSHYIRTRRGPQHHLGLDKAYAPRGVVDDAHLRTAVTSSQAERITAWQDGEWRDSCQSAESPMIWRLARNVAVSDGVTQLLKDLELAFPHVRIRAIVPPRESTIERIEQTLESMPVPSGGTYGRAYYQKLWCSNNHIPGIGEGMAMVNLTGTRVEPVFLGSGGYLPESGPFELFVREQIADLADNRGSQFHGPRSYFYEGQFTLRASDSGEARRQRDQMISYLLTQQEDIREVLLYEAADWLYFMPLAESDPWGSLDERRATTP